MSIHRAVALLLGALSTAGAASCQSAQLEAALEALGEGCLLDSDCEDDLICVFRRCHVECETTKDCRDRGEDTDCVLGDASKVCLLSDEESCTVDDVDEGGVTVALYLHATCPSDALLCARDGACRNPCASDADCLASARCTVTGVCAEPEDADDPSNAINEAGEHGVATATCLYSSECIAPLICREHQCREACLADADCPPEQRCMAVESPALGKSFGACRFVNDDPSLPASCKNGLLDDDESDVDCGGPLCATCSSGASCTGPSDCQSAICEGAVCQVPSCDDGVNNANESDVDCGGPQCAPCGVGAGCFGPADCQPALVCDPGTFQCAAATCSDGSLNGDESDVDCGGGCGPCGDFAICGAAADCTSGVCVAGACQPASCSDGIHNGNETGLDCGSACTPCGVGAGCAAASDCASGSCSGGFCAAPTCSDGVQNGAELGVDCGGALCATSSQGCPLGTACNVDSDCDLSAPAGCEPTSQQCTAKHAVSVTVTGAGYVLSNPAGINCHDTAPSLCTLTVYGGESVTLTGYGSSFAGFSGGCSGNPSCTFTVTADAAVTATFP